MPEVTVPAEETPAMEPTGDETPDSLAKFKDENGEVDKAKLAEAYLNLERKHSAPKEEEEDGGAPKEDASPKETPSAKEAQEAAEEALTVAGVDVSDLSQEFAATGQLSPESYTKLDEAGFSKDVVDTYIKGLKSDMASAQEAAQSTVDSIYESFGGKEEYEAAVVWSNQNLPDSEKAFFQRAAKEGDLEGLRVAAENMRLRYFQANPQRPKLVKGKTTPNTGVTGYASLEEMRKDMANPEYKRDPAFMRKVQERMKNSKLFGDK